MRHVSLFGKIKFITKIGLESSFMFEEGNVLIVTELSRATYDYFKNNLGTLTRIRSIIFCLTDKLVYNTYRDSIYLMIKNYNTSIKVNFISLSEKSYIEDNDIEKICRKTDDFYFIKTNERDVTIVLLGKEKYRNPIYRIIYQIDEDDYVMYTGLNGKLYTNESADFYEAKNHIIMINRNYLGDIPTEELYDAYQSIFKLDMINTIFMGYKSNIEKKYFESRISSLWQPKIEAPATKMNTSIEKARETETKWKGVAQSYGKPE